MFRGAPVDLIEQVRGHVWAITTSGDRPTEGLAVVSTLQLQHSVQYRVLGMSAPTDSALALEPSLEDGYIWLMRQHNGAA